ncbi:MAG: ribosome silencing factor [Gemmatimonadales bacterium]
MTTAKSPDTRIDKEALRDLELAVSALEEHQALDVVVLDLRRISDVADFFVIATGSSDAHVRSLAESVLEAIKGAGRTPHHVEGVSAGRWALLDFVDVVIHLFHPTLRQYYQLERLWSDAPLVATGSSG